MIKIGGLANPVDNPFRDGYIFSGWNTASDGSGLTWNFATTIMLDSDITVYAQWIQNKRSELLDSENKSDNQANEIGKISRKSLPKTGGYEGLSIGF